MPAFHTAGFIAADRLDSAIILPLGNTQSSRWKSSRSGVLVKMRATRKRSVSAYTDCNSGKLQSLPISNSGSPGSGNGMRAASISVRARDNKPASRQNSMMNQPTAGTAFVFRLFERVSLITRYTVCAHDL